MPDSVELPRPPAGLVRPGASETRSRIASGLLSARQALEDCLVVIEKLNAEINAVVAMDIPAARSRADSLDSAQAKGQPIGRLHGVPVTLKETFDIAGMPTTWGDPERAGHVATRNSSVAARLLARGAVILGKTNVPERLADWETRNRLFGATRNPWHCQRSAGGSSGGSAAAVASAMASADIGTDQGGSIRIPAHYCGVYGLKPTWNIIPLAGNALPSGKRNPDMNVAGPIARRPEDLCPPPVGPGGSGASGTPLAGTLRCPLRWTGRCGHAALPVSSSIRIARSIGRIWS